MKETDYLEYDTIFIYWRWVCTRGVSKKIWKNETICIRIRYLFTAIGFPRGVFVEKYEGIRLFGIWYDIYLLQLVFHTVFSKKIRKKKTICIRIRYLFTAIGFPRRVFVGKYERNRLLWIWYDISLLQLVFHPVAMGHKLVHSTRTVMYIRRNNTDHRTHKIESKTHKKIQ